jgi:hypothetical protein
MAESDGEEKHNPGAYEVGYRRPPQEHRFRKGVSGNPSGRPRAKSRGKEKLDSANEPTKAMILNEAYRTVTVR